MSGKGKNSLQIHEEQFNPGKILKDVLEKRRAVVASDSENENSEDEDYSNKKISPESSGHTDKDQALFETSETNHTIVEQPTKPEIPIMQNGPNTPRKSDAQDAQTEKPVTITRVATSDLPPPPDHPIGVTPGVTPGYRPTGGMGSFATTAGSPTPSSPRERTASSGSSTGTVTPVSPRGGEATKWSILHPETAARFDAIAKKITTNEASLEKGNYKKTWGEDWDSLALRESLFELVKAFNEQKQIVDVLQKKEFNEKVHMNIQDALDKKTLTYEARHNARHSVKTFIEKSTAVQNKHSENAKSQYVDILRAEERAGNRFDIADRTQLTAKVKLFYPMLVTQYSMKLFVELTNGIGEKLPFAPELSLQFTKILTTIDEKIKRYGAAAAIPGTIPNLNESLLNLYTALDLKKVFETERGNLTRMTETALRQLKNDKKATEHALELLDKNKGLNKEDKKPQKKALETTVEYINQKIKHTTDLQGYAATYLEETIKSANKITETLSERLVDVVITNPEKQTGQKDSTQFPNSKHLDEAIPKLISAYTGDKITSNSDPAVTNFEKYLATHCKSMTSNVIATAQARTQDMLRKK